MESLVGLFRERLFEAFWDWVDANEKVIDERMLNHLTKEGKKAEDECNTALRIVACAMWMLNMIGSCGIMAGVGPDSISDQTNYKETGIDEKTTKRLLLMIQACLNLQYLPPEIAKQEIPIISGKHFSLKLFVQERKGEDNEWGL
jgi:hypothetical protein